MRQYTPLQVAVPPRTTQGSPVTATWSLYPGWVHTFRIDIPGGHKGLTGIRLTYMQRPVVPFHDSIYLIGDGATFSVPWEDEIMNRGLVVQAFNTDQFTHTFYLFADVDPYEQLPTVNIRAPVRPGTPSAATAANLSVLGRE